MSRELNRIVVLCMAAGLLVGATSCTAIDESVKADLASGTSLSPNSPEMRAARAAEAASLQSTPTSSEVAVMTADQLAAANPGPAPKIPGTDTSAPIPQLKASALASTTTTDAAKALDMVTSPSGSSQSSVPAPTATGELAASSPSATAPANSAAQPPVTLAYANPARSLDLTSFGDPFDVTPPKDVQEKESRKSTTGPTVINALVEKYAAKYQMPAELIHRVIKRESTYNPAAYSKGNYGLMQIRYNTARGLGYKGTPEGLFDAETNMKYAVRYLRGAWLVADKDHDHAIRLYSRGYYYDAKRKGMLHVLQGG